MCSDEPSKAEDAIEAYHLGDSSSLFLRGIVHVSFPPSITSCKLNSEAAHKLD